MQRDQLTAQICLALMRLGTSLSAEFDRQFQPSGLTQAQFRALLALRDLGSGAGVTPSALADHLLVGRASVTGLLSRLETRGWITRRPGENRRSHRVFLTSAGGEVLTRAAPDATRLAEHTLRTLSGANLHALHGGLQAVEAELREYTPPEETP